ncbi:PREDICTED: uncharacterized protein LOC105449507 [Wasmannia auropunctata]|uniref:uncharacterized protein LOC105449507 n=1 Tax=Wasmannia auropunctata TaxID=64793 RepID=UPI0005F00069|nr:PREDICTED: uncharacterized protein LOC105449507 [Wasmannia auropunctata]
MLDALTYQKGERLFIINNFNAQVWHLAKKSGEALILEYYNTLLGVDEEDSKSVNLTKFLASMSVEPDGNTYGLLLNAIIKAGNSEHLWHILSVIKDKNVTISEKAIDTLVQICTVKNNVAEVEQMITLMQEAKLPTAKAYTELACRYAKLGDIPNLVKILNDEPQDNANLLRIIKILNMSNNSRHIPVILNFLMTSEPTIESEISKMIVELIRADQVADAHIVINYLTMNDATKDIARSLVNSFMNELVTLNVSIQNIIRYANDFVDSSCSRQALTDVGQIGLKLGREKLCFAIFEAMRCKVYPYINTARPIDALQKLQLSNIPKVIMFTPLLSFLLQHNRLHDVKVLCNYKTAPTVYYKELMMPLVRSYLATKDTNTYITLLMAFPQGQDFIGFFFKALMKYSISQNEFELILEELTKHKAKISQEEASILKNRLQNRNFTLKMMNLIDNLTDQTIMKNVPSISHMMFMNTKELTCYKVELKHKKFNIHKILHKLLIMHCLENNLKQAEEIKREYNACQYKWSPGMKLLLFELYLKHDKLNEAEALMADLQTSDKIVLDRIKIIRYAIALVKADNPTKAFDVIEKISIINHEVNMQDYCCTLLQVLAKSRYHARTADMLKLLLQRNYCEITVELLRPLMMISLKHNNIQDTVNVFTDCAQKYRETPLALELLTILLQEKYSTNLYDANNYIEQVYDIIAATHSVDVANTILAIALATLNKTEKLQTLLQNHKLSTKSLVYYIYNVENNCSFDGFQNILKVADANHVNQTVICETLLIAYSRKGNCNRALELWNIMCTKNIEPSEVFKNNFIQFLLSNKIPLPSELDGMKEFGWKKVSD